MISISNIGVEEGDTIGIDGSEWVVTGFERDQTLFSSHRERNVYTTTVSLYREIDGCDMRAEMLLEDLIELQ